MSTGETIAACLRRGAALLQAAGIDDARREARLLLAHALGRDAAGLHDAHQLIDPPGYDRLLIRRAAHEPMAFILGRQGFWTLDLAVSPATLIPRADTETLVEAVLDAIPDRQTALRVLDLGTGTGCLLLAVLAEYTQAWGVGLDRSAPAAALAARNARANGLDGRAGFVVGNWAMALAGGFDLVLSNPPYIPGSVIAGLMPEVRAHEPATALDGGPDGLEAYRRIIAALPDLLRPGGLAVLELGIGQQDAVQALAKAARLGVMAMRRDLGGIARAMVLGRSTTGL